LVNRHEHSPLYFIEITSLIDDKFEHFKRQSERNEVHGM